MPRLIKVWVAMLTLPSVSKGRAYGTKGIEENITYFFNLLPHDTEAVQLRQAWPGDSLVMFDV